MDGGSGSTTTRRPRPSNPLKSGTKWKWKKNWWFLSPFSLSPDVGQEKIPFLKFFLPSPPGLRDAGMLVNINIKDANPWLRANYHHHHQQLFNCFFFRSFVFPAWVLGKVMCKLVPYVQSLSVCASVYSLVAVSLDRWDCDEGGPRHGILRLYLTCAYTVIFSRFIAIWYPLGRGLTKRRARWIILLIWSAAACLASPSIIVFDIEKGYEEAPTWEFCTEQWPPEIDGSLYFLLANLFLCYLFPLSGISMCYVLIWFRVLRRNVPTEESANQNLTKIHRKAKVGVLRMLIVVVFVFLLSWLPLYLLFARVKLGSAFTNTEAELFEVLTPIAQWLGSSNSSINPILYAFLNVKFRRAFRALLPCGSRSQIRGNVNFPSNGTKSSIIQRQQTVLYSIPVTSGV